MFKRWGYWAVIALILLGIYAFTSTVPQDRTEENARVSKDKAIIDLSVNPQKPELSVKMDIPIVYMGPEFLNLSKTNRIGGEQKRVLVQFYYPSLLPNTPENASLEGKEILLYASVTTGAPGSTRRIALHYVASSGERTVLYSPTNKEKCGLSEYKFTDKIPLDRHAFYYKNIEIDGDANIETVRDNVYADDVFIVCDLTGTPVDGIDRCNFTFDTEEGLSLDLRAVPMSHICDWPQISSGVRTLLDGFVIKKES